VTRPVVTVCDDLSSTDATRPDRSPALHGSRQRRRPARDLRAVAAAGYRSSNWPACATAPRLGGSSAPGCRRSPRTSIDHLRGDADAVADRRPGPLLAVIVPWMLPEMAPDRRRRGVSPGRSVASPAARDHGIRLGYHNHDFEFRSPARRPGHPARELAGGRTQLDVYWLAVGGAIVAGRGDVDRPPRPHEGSRAGVGAATRRSGTGTALRSRRGGLRRRRR
jgi:hypothetical protein